jgi:hypothetical protein
MTLANQNLAQWSGDQRKPSWRRFWGTWEHYFCSALVRRMPDAFRRSPPRNSIPGICNTFRIAPWWQSFSRRVGRCGRSLSRHRRRRGLRSRTTVTMSWLSVCGRTSSSTRVHATKSRLNCVPRRSQSLLRALFGRFHDYIGARPELMRITLRSTSALATHSSVSRSIWLLLRRMSANGRPMVGSQHVPPAEYRPEDFDQPGPGLLKFVQNLHLVGARSPRSPRGQGLPADTPTGEDGTARLANAWRHLPSQRQQDNRGRTPTDPDPSCRARFA